MDTDVSHEVDRRLTALEEKVGIGGETKPDDEEGDKPGHGPHEDEEVEEEDAEEEAD